MLMSIAHGTLCVATCTTYRLAAKEKKKKIQRAVNDPVDIYGY
jgi:hypothetical protein